MSGGGTPGWPETSGVPCDQLTFETVLSSPQQQVISGLSIDDQLAVQLDESDGVRKVVALTSAGAIVGTVTSAQLFDLLECLQEGAAFVADILDLDGGIVRVRIHAG